MTHPMIAAARDFVRDTELPEPPPLDVNLTKSSTFRFDGMREQASVVGSEVIAFAKGVTREQRQDIVNATLLAQLVARKRTAEPTSLDEVKGWYDDYFDTLSKVGFVLQQRDFARYHERSESFEAHEAILDVAATLLAGSPGALALVTSTLEALKKASADSPWITVFNRESTSANTARFQVSLVERDDGEQLLLSLIAFALHAERALTQVLFFKFRRNEVQLDHHQGKVTINAPVLAAIREPLAGKLVAFANEFIQGLPEL